MGTIIETCATYAAKNRTVESHLDFFQLDISPTGLVRLEAPQKTSGCCVNKKRTCITHSRMYFGIAILIQL